MARLSARSVRSKQNATLRYIASSDIERTARDYGVSTRTLRNFIKADPKSLNQSTYNKFLAADAKGIAKNNDVRLVPRLSGERYREIRALERPTERQERSVRYTAATRERYKKVDKSGKVRYLPASQERIEQNRKQILAGMAGTNTKTIVALYQEGSITRGEARGMMRKLFANSGVSKGRADAAFRKAIGE